MVWVKRWVPADQVVTEGPAHLDMLNSELRRLDDDEFGGVKLAGSTGPWAQVMHMGGGDEIH